MGLLDAIFNENESSLNRDYQQSQFEESQKFNKDTRDLQNEQWERQFKFAQDEAAYQKKYHGQEIQRRVQDAKKAGIHPLAALGMPSSGGPGVQIPGSPNGPAGPAPVGPPGGFMAQGILESVKEIASLAKVAIQGQDKHGGAFNVNPQQITSSHKKNISITPAAVSGVTWVRISPDKVFAAKSKDAAELLEDDAIGNWRHAIMREIVQRPPDSMLPKGKYAWKRANDGSWVAITREQFIHNEYRKKRKQEIKRKTNKYKGGMFRGVSEYIKSQP